MKLSPSTRYGIRFLFELAQVTEPLALNSLSERTGISLRALENIQAVLKQQGVTDALVGARGGILLKKPLAEISLGDMVRLFDDGVEFAVCCGEKSNDCPNQLTCDNRSAWRGVSALIREQLDAISLETIFRNFPRRAGLDDIRADRAKAGK